MSALGHWESLTCGLLDVISSASAISDPAGIAAIVARTVKRAASACDRCSPLVTNINLNLTDLLRTEKGVLIFSICARACHLSVVIPEIFHDEIIHLTGCERTKLGSLCRASHAIRDAQDV